jgi:hypothetical protein
MIPFVKPASESCCLDPPVWLRRWFQGQRQLRYTATSNALGLSDQTGTELSQSLSEARSQGVMGARAPAISYPSVVAYPRVFVCRFSQEGALGL